MNGVLVGLGHAGLELLEEERIELVRVGGGLGGGGLEGGKAGEDRAEPGQGGVGAKAGEVGPNEREVGEVAGGSARLVVGRLRGIAVGVEPRARGGGEGEVSGHVGDGNSAVGGEGRGGLEGGGGDKVGAGA